MGEQVVQVRLLLLGRHCKGQTEREGGSYRQMETDERERGSKKEREGEFVPSLSHRQR